MINSRFATYDEITSPEFERLNLTLNELHRQYNLQDHSNLNQQRFNWIEELSFKPSYYASRLWEFPFAILSAEIREGMTVADVGCGNTPFTAYLAQIAGPKNVTGYDPDYIESDAQEGHSHFGARKSFIDSIGINFFKEGITGISAPNDYYDRVFCISVLEHIENIETKQKGIKELVRILKPGGRLILTFDLGIKLPLNNILDILQYSGLTPFDCINLKFPKERFVNYGQGTNVDVFGLVLEKNPEMIFVDHNKQKEIPQYSAYDRYAELAGFYALAYSDVLAARDLKRKFGPFRVLIKSLLKKY
jgi:SAM-dependent methyltransferase